MYDRAVACGVLNAGRWLGDAPFGASGPIANVDPNHDANCRTRHHNKHHDANTSRIAGIAKRHAASDKEHCDPAIMIRNMSPTEARNVPILASAVGSMPCARLTFDA